MENSPFTDDFPIKTAMCRGFQLPRLLPRGEVVPHVKIWTPFRRFHRPAKPQLENHSAEYIQIWNMWLRKIMNGCMSLEISYIILYVILYHISIYLSLYIHIMYSICPNSHWSTMNIPISWVLGNMKSQLHHDFSIFFGQTTFSDTPKYGKWWFQTWILWLSIQLGISSSQLTWRTHIFQDG